MSSMFKHFLLSILSHQIVEKIIIKKKNAEKIVSKIVSI